MSSRSQNLPPSGSGRRVAGRGRGRAGGSWTGSSRWSPYASQQDRLWPKLLIVGVILTVVLGGSILAAGALGGGDDDDDTAGVADDQATATVTESSDSGDESPTSTEDEDDSDAPLAPSPVGDTTATPEASPSPTPLDPDSLATARGVADAFVQAWSDSAYSQMYDLISEESQDTISREEFVDRYEAIGLEAGIIELAAEVTAGEPDDLIFPVEVDIDSSRIGEFTEENQIPVLEDDGEYRVDWSPSLIFQGLGDGLVRWTSDVPQRGRILDRKGRPLAETGFINRVGIIPGQISNEDEMLNQLSDMLEMEADAIRAAYEGGQPNWFMPVKDFPEDMDPAFIDELGQIDGVVIQKWPSRSYPLGEAAAHITGYMSEITAEELPELVKEGYEAGDMIGRGGVEASAEQWLAGKRGGTLALINRDGSPIRVLGEVEAEPAHDVVLTIDLDLQRATHDAIEEETGAAVVMDPHNGQVLAIASRPSFDPNAFILGLDDETWDRINDPEQRPLVNRATQSTYPTGSVFKLITASAGIVHLGYTADTWFNCPGSFSLPGADQVWTDWIPGGQGEMNLHRAIYRSCNTVFYQIGEELDKGNEMWLPEMARAYGFGERTGLDALYEVPGTVPGPEWKQEVVGDNWARGDAVNLAIGQGFFGATPLQLANAYAAITNGGTLWKPYMIMDVIDVNGEVVYSGEAEEIRKLPLNAEQLKILTDGMYDVVHAGDGTAVSAFQGAAYEVSGKTGTAETGREGEDAHGWFGSFAPSDNPRITVASVVEHGVTGSGSAAPVARRIYDAYFELYPQ